MPAGSPGRTCEYARSLARPGGSARSAAKLESECWASSSWGGSVSWTGWARAAWAPSTGPSTSASSARLRSRRSRARDARRVLREAQAAARLNHPGIVTLYELGSRTAARCWSASWSRGRRWRNSPSARGSPIARSAEFGADICEALAHAHERGVVHRDVKPQNVIVRADDGVGRRAKLMDFGIASLAGAAGSDGDRRGGRDARLHGAGAGRGRAGRRARRRLLARADALRVVGGHESRRPGDPGSDRAGDRPAASLASRVPPGPARASFRRAWTPACVRSQSCVPRSPSSTIAPGRAAVALTADAPSPRRAPPSSEQGPVSCASRSSWRWRHGAWRSPLVAAVSGTRGWLWSSAR